MHNISPFPNSYEQNACIAKNQSEKKIVEAIKEHLSFEVETEQSGGFTVNENKAIKMFNYSCTLGKKKQKYVVSPLLKL